MPHISQIFNKNTQWINISAKGPEEAEFLKKGFNFSTFDIEECFNQTKRSQIFPRRDYIYFEVLFPIYNKQTQLISAAEINFFIKEQTLLTVHNGDINQLTHFFNSLEQDEQLKDNTFGNNPIILLCGILNRLLDSCFPMLMHMEEDVETLEKQIFTAHQKTNTQTILRIRWNIINFRRIMQSYKKLIEELIINGEFLFSMSKLKIYYQNLLEKIKDIWIMLENQKDSIAALQQTNESLISFQLNDIMKTLALISAIMMPPAFLTSLFGVNAKIPLIEHPSFFFFILGGCVFIIALFLMYFRKKKWF